MMHGSAYDSVRVSSSPPVSDGAYGCAGALFVEGRRAWPRIALTLDGFVALAGRHLRAAEGTPLSPDLYLATACIAGDGVALAELERTYLAKLGLHVARIVERSGVAQVDDVVQAVRERLLVGTPTRPGRLREYSGRGPLGAFLRVIAVRLAIEHTRRAVPKQGGDVLAIPCGADRDLDHLRALHGAAFKRWLEAGFGSLSKDERAVLRLTYRDGMTGDRMARILGIDRSNVVRRVVRARAALLAATRTAMRAESAMSDGEFSSLARALGPHVGVTLSRVLASTDG